MNRNLVKRIAFETETLPQLDGLYRAALYLMGNESEAQELTQECFVEAYRSWHQYRVGSNCRLWLFGIMANVLANKYTPPTGAPALTIDAGRIDASLLLSRTVIQKPADYSVPVPISVLSEEVIKKAIVDLPQEFKLPVVLSLLEGFSNSEIADIAGIHLQTAIRKLKQGRRLITENLLMFWRANAPAGNLQIQSGAEE
jgi:RNA polymerase sigma-70 factor (ECF subfamily)